MNNYETACKLIEIKNAALNNLNGKSSRDPEFQALTARHSLAASDVFAYLSEHRLEFTGDFEAAFKHTIDELRDIAACHCIFERATLAMLQHKLLPDDAETRLLINIAKKPECKKWWMWNLAELQQHLAPFIK